VATSTRRPSRSQVLGSSSDVHRYEGYVVQSRGDGIFALFGAPIAQEDHARRALYAALRMQEDIKRYSDHAPDRP
jgi:class 3 adenylate cyclase